MVSNFEGERQRKRGFLTTASGQTQQRGLGGYIRVGRREIGAVEGRLISASALTMVENRASDSGVQLFGSYQPPHKEKSSHHRPG